MKRRYLLLLLSISACTPLTQPCPRAAEGDVVYVVEQGWHAEIGVPVDELDAHLAFYCEVFPQAHVIMFGYGKRTFFTAHADSLAEYILGPVPGPAAIHVVALSVMPTEAYSDKNIVKLMLPKGGARALSEYIWNDIAKDASGKPQVISRSHDPDGLFYAAQSRYNLAHTCNTWTADALNRAGLEITVKEVTYAGQVMAQADYVAQNQCRLLLSH